MPQPSRHELIPYHEAAQAVFCFEEHIEIEYPTMREGDGYSAGIKHADLPTWVRAVPEQDMQHRARGALKMLLAGHQMALLIEVSSMGTDWGNTKKIADLQKQFSVDGATTLALVDAVKVALE